MYLSGCLHPECLMGSMLVVPIDPSPQYLIGLVDRVEPMKPDTLLLDRPDLPLNHTILYWHVRLRCCNSSFFKAPRFWMNKLR